MKRTFAKSENKMKESYQVGIQISQSSSSFTKLHNSAPFDIVLMELKDEEEGVVVGAAGLCVPFWPIYGGGAMVCRALEHEGVTVHSSLMEQ